MASVWHFADPMFEFDFCSCKCCFLVSSGLTHAFPLIAMLRIVTEASLLVYCCTLTILLMMMAQVAETSRGVLCDGEIPLDHLHKYVHTVNNVHVHMQGVASTHAFTFECTCAPMACLHRHAVVERLLRCSCKCDLNVSDKLCPVAHSTLRLAFNLLFDAVSSMLSCVAPARHTGREQQTCHTNRECQASFQSLQSGKHQELPLLARCYCTLMTGKSGRELSLIKSVRLCSTSVFGRATHTRPLFKERA